MPAYKIGITEINTQVRRLGYVSAILSILGHKPRSESLLYDRLEKWSRDHKLELMASGNQQGQIKPTRQRTGAKRYTAFAVSLGLIGRIAGAYRVTRFGKTLLPFLNRTNTRNPFELNLAERCAYLYWLLLKDGDRFFTVLDMLAEPSEQPLSRLQNDFQAHYLRRLGVRISTEKGHVAREILALRNRVAHDWKNPKRYAEHIVPPRIHWLVDLGLASISEGRGKPARLTGVGNRFRYVLPKLQAPSVSGVRFAQPASRSIGDTNLVYASPSWLRCNFFGVAGPIFADKDGQRWAELSREERKERLRNLMSQAFETLRTTPVPKVSLYPALIYMALLIAMESGIWANLDELHADLDAFSKELDTVYEVRFSRRENESYLIFMST